MRAADDSAITRSSTEDGWEGSFVPEIKNSHYIQYAVRDKKAEDRVEAGEKWASRLGAEPAPKHGSP